MEKKLVLETNETFPIVVNGVILTNEVLRSLIFFQNDYQWIFDALADIRNSLIELSSERKTGIDFMQHLRDISLLEDLLKKISNINNVS